MGSFISNVDLAFRPDRGTDIQDDNEKMDTLKAKARAVMSHYLPWNEDIHSFWGSARTAKVGEIKHFHEERIKIGMAASSDQCILVTRHA